jgi:NTF2-related export protein 1/2
MVVVAGTARYDKNETKSFLQNFLVTVQETKWKIASDCFRYQEVQT